MAVISSSIIIKSPLGGVVSAFKDFESYPQWTSFIEKIEYSSLNVGDSLKVTIKLPDSGKQNIFTPTILVNEDNCFKWSGTLFSDYIFQGIHCFEFLGLPDNTTEVIQSESFSGALSWLVMRMIGQDTEHGFQNFNQSLKKRVEATVGDLN